MFWCERMPRVREDVRTSRSEKALFTVVVAVLAVIVVEICSWALMPELCLAVECLLVW